MFIFILIILIFISIVMALFSLKGILSKKEINKVREELSKGKVIYKDYSSDSES